VSEVSSSTLSQKQDEPFSTAVFLFRRFLSFDFIVSMLGNQMVLEINANQRAFSNKADPLCQGVLSLLIHRDIFHLLWNGRHTIISE
jgi:hypothetical protein